MLRGVFLRRGGHLHRPGLTLIEVMLAVSILAFALLGVAGMFPSAMRSVQGGGETTKATVLAREMIDMIRSAPFDTLNKPFASPDWGYAGFYTQNPLADLTCPPRSDDPDPDRKKQFNHRKWMCDILASGTRDTGQGLPDGRGTVTVTCVDFDTTSPFKEKKITCPTPGPTDYSTRKVTVAVTWGAQGSRSVSLVTYVTKTE
jgi:prepilin-type N-terminal cleavage/methylation domain-containing protein